MRVPVILHPRRDHGGNLSLRNQTLTPAGLRQAPPQRVLFQNDVTNARPIRQPSQHASPAPQPSGLYSAANGLHHLNGVPSSLANYEPKQQVPLTLRPVVTPGNNPELFKANQKQLRDAYQARTSRAPLLTKGMMLPGSKCSLTTAELSSAYSE